ncbi:MAG: LLM class flavin-dependent oxidoreductase [Dehalococcoidia bacterium]
MTRCASPRRWRCSTTSGGRMILGIGRGLGRVEYEGFRLEMSESRTRFNEYADMILTGLEQGYVEYDGIYLKQPRRDIRPAPFRSFRGRTYAAAVSPDSMPIMARLGTALLVIPQKPWEDVARDFAVYHDVWAETHGAAPPPKPLMAGFFFVDSDAERARELGTRYIGGYYHTVIRHYEMTAGHFATLQGYEFYHQATKYINRHGDDGAAQSFANLMPWGTPDQVLRKLEQIRSYIDMNGILCHFSFAGMPWDEAERNMRLFAAEVLPELKRWDTEPLAEPRDLAGAGAGMASR